MQFTPHLFIEHARRVYKTVLCKTRRELIWYGCIVTLRRPGLFRGRHFEDVILLRCVRWYRSTVSFVERRPI